jgi:hypothetical protein
MEWYELVGAMENLPSGQNDRKLVIVNVTVFLLLLCLTTLYLLCHEMK